MKKRIMLSVLLCMLLLAIPQTMLAMNEPTCSIVFDKDTVVVGEKITATYEVIGTGDYSEISWDWYILTDEENGWQSFSDYAWNDSTELSGEFSITPTYGSALMCKVMVKEKTGLRHIFDSHSVIITGDTSKKPKVEIAFDKKEALIDEPITVAYRISGEGQYTDVTCQWCVYTDDNSYQSSSENDQSSTELSGEFEFVPQFGVKLGCEIWVTENTGRRYVFKSDTIKVSGDNSRIPSASIKLNREEVGIGETISAAFNVEGTGNYEYVSWEWYLKTDENSWQSASLNEDNMSFSMSGVINYTVRYGEALYCEIWVREDTGRHYTFESEICPIVGFATDYDIYSVIEGADGQVADGNMPLVFRADGEFEDFLGIQVDGKYLSKNAYTAWEGSTYVELSVDYLNTLSDGQHEIVIVFNDGIAKSSFVVERKLVVSLPQTGDDSQMMLWGMVLGISVITLVLVKRKKLSV